MAAGFSPNIAHHADEWDTGTALVAHGFGIILVPRLARLHDDWPVVRIPLRGEPAPARRILAATRRGVREQPITAAALAAISDRVAAVLAATGRDGRRTGPDAQGRHHDLPAPSGSE